MGDWADESPSEEDDINEIENELYSMFYYHSMSDGIPEDLSKKYNVDIDDFGVTISLKDAIHNCPSNEATSRSDQINEENESENVIITNDRYIDRRKQGEDFVSKKQNVSVDRHISDSEISKALSTKLPVHSPNYHFPPKISRFQSSRYFFQGSTNIYTPGHNFRYRDTNYSTNLFKNQSRSLLNVTSKNMFHHDAVLSSTPMVKRKSNYLNKSSLKKLKNESQCPIIIKDNEEVIDLTQGLSMKRKTKNKKITSHKSEDPVITISSGSEYDNDSDLTTTDSISDFDSEDNMEESFDSILLNTSISEDRDYCDISAINIDYDWRQTSSPEGWTHSMRKFYNKPSKKLLNFDYKDIIQEIRNQGSGDWSICKADLHRYKGSRRIRCLRCQQEGHVKAHCTKVISCHMCGTPGHSSTKCPQKMCLKCGSKCRDVFPSGCGNCVNEGKTPCSICGLQGHNSTFCTDAWRSQSLIDGNKTSKGRTNLKYCCNCAKSGHYYEDCRNMSDSTTNSQGGNWKSFKANFTRNRNPKHKRHFKDDSHNPLPMNHSRSKFRLRSKMNRNSRNEMHMDFHFPNRKKKNGQVSKRILMLRKSNKRNMFKPCLSTTI